MDRAARETSTVVPPVILHVLPVDLSRGAQTYARDLRDLLDGQDAAHRTLTIFRSDGDTLAADYRLDVPDGRLRRLGADLRGVLRLRRLCRDIAPAAVVAHGGEPLKYAVLAGVPRSRLVYYKIGIGSARLRGSRRRLHRALCRRAGAVAAVSESVAKEVRSFGVEPDRLRVIPNGRDAQTYGSHTRSERSGPVRLGFVGHLTASKRPARFVELVRALGSEGFAVEGLVAGAGPLLDALKFSARDLPIQLLGAVEDVPRVLNECDIFVFTSVAAGEGMPGVLIEAGLASLPVVTTAVPGAADVVQDGTTGFIVGVDEMAALVDATRRLVENPALREQMGSAARRRCVDRFSLEKSAQQWHDLLDDLIVGVCASST
jgi:glycosyltransferase involved in cell wall biosynthesis